MGLTSLINGAIKDAILTSIFVFTMPFLGVSSSIAASYLNLQPKSLPSLFLTINIASIFMLTFTFISAIMGGASFNPTTTVALYTAGLKPDATLFSMALRFPAQAVGGIVDAKAILILMPDPYKQILKGPYLKTDLHIGAIAEGVMSFVLCWFCFWFCERTQEFVRESMDFDSSYYRIGDRWWRVHRSVFESGRSSLQSGCCYGGEEAQPRS